MEEQNNGLQAVYEQETFDKIDTRKASDIMMYGVLTVKKQTPIYQAIAVLVDRNISGLPVVNDDMELQGIITEKDVLRLLYGIGRGSGSVEEYMTEDVVSFDQDDYLADICGCLAQSDFRRVTILKEGKLISLISRSDLIRANVARFIPRRIQLAEPPRDSFAAKNVMKRHLLTVQKDTPVYMAMKFLADNHITGLPVVTEDMTLIGIVSEKDIIKLLYDPNSKVKTVEEVMTENVTSFSPNDSLLTICQCLIDNPFRRVTIVKDQKLVGIVSRSDIIRFILKHQAEIFKRRQTDLDRG